MRIFVWHGYLLADTGSNIYTRQLAREWSRAGHDVTVFSQDPDPTRYDLGGAETVRPDVHGLLPVFVLDDYPGYRVARVQDCSRAELEGWVEDNASALRERDSADFLLVNHILLGGPVGAASGSPYVVKAHGSELEYSMRGNEELSRWGADVLTGAQATLVGSEHIRDVVAEICGTVDRVHTIPPGVDIELWRPQPRDEALAALLAESRDDPPNPGSRNERLPDEDNAERLPAFLAGDRKTVVF
jgi:glycosyltransferase involved in cell wall biosynthesis